MQLWLRMALEWDFGYISEPLAAFRVHDATTSRNIGAEDGVLSGEQELLRVHAETRYRRRMSFLGSAPLKPADASRSRRLAAHQYLAERAALGCPGARSPRSSASSSGPPRASRCVPRSGAWSSPSSAAGGRARRSRAVRRGPSGVIRPREITLGDDAAPASGHSIPKAGSSQRTPLAAVGITRGSSGRRPRSRPPASGSPARSPRHVQQPPVLGRELDAEPVEVVPASSGRRSTITTYTAPRVQRMSLSSACGASWKCRPRSVSRYGL